jgi:hypothetical protein
MAAYAANCANTGQFESWTMCHDINGQWTLRNSTAAWLRRLVDDGCLGEAVRPDLTAAAAGYRTAYEEWTRCYELLGHGAGEAQRRDGERRRQVAAMVRRAARHERQAISHLRHVLQRPAG